MTTFEESGGVDFLRTSCAVDIHVLPSSTSLEEFYEFFLKSQATSSAVFFVNLYEIVEMVRQWTTLLPRVKPHYAVKCNDDAVVLTTLMMCGCGFDCSSQSELETILSMGVSPSDIIYANTVKEEFMLTFADQSGIVFTTFDCCDELRKLKHIAPDMRLLIRIAVDDSDAVCKFSSKFGAQESDWPQLFALASSLDLDVVGVSFHVGSGQKTASAFSEAICASSRAFSLASHYGYDFDMLDIGGGFPGSRDNGITFQDISMEVNRALDTFFQDKPSLRVVAEPGRVFVKSSHTLATTVIGKKKLCAEQLSKACDAERVGNESQGMQPVSSSGEQACMSLTLNCGLYDAFSNIVFDHEEVVPKSFKSGKLRKFKIFGPTCDSIDVVSKSESLPETLERGDRLLFENMGAYTTVSSSRFNGQGSKTFCYFISG